MVDSYPGTDPDLWASRNWSPYFRGRISLEQELALLERLFPLEWRLEALHPVRSKHQLRGDLLSVGGRTRLLVLAAELLRLTGPSAGPQIPMQGRLRYWRLYQPTKSEFLVGPILRPVGDVKWQPEGTRHGADYLVIPMSSVCVAEVKRPCTAKRQNQIASHRVIANLGYSGAVFTADEHTENMREDARRLYPHVRYAAKQLKQSAAKAARRIGRPAAAVPGILFLDLDGNRCLVNLRERIRQWMERPWARSIDLVLFFDFGCRYNVWGTIVQAIYSRSHRALDTLAHALPSCSRGHFHIGNLPTGPCEYALPF